MNGNDDNTPALRATPVDLGTTVERATPPPPAPGPQRAEQISDPSPLASSRVPFAQEMQQNPDLRRKFIATINAEIEPDDNDAAKQAFIESVFNRSAARGMSLDAALKSDHANGGYFDHKTIARQNDPVPQDIQNSLNPMINSASGGSNVSNFSTGNQAPPLADPVNFDPQGKHQNTFVIENKPSDTKWVAGMRPKQTLFQDSLTLEPAPTPWTAPAGPAGSPGSLPAPDQTGNPKNGNGGSRNGASDSASD
jgi:hypothetical protein